MSWTIFCIKTAFLREVSGSSKIEGKVQRFPMYSLPTHMHHHSPPPPSIINASHQSGACAVTDGSIPLNKNPNSVDGRMKNIYSSPLETSVLPALIRWIGKKCQPWWPKKHVMEACIWVVGMEKSWQMGQSLTYSLFYFKRLRRGWYLKNASPPLFYWIPIAKQYPDLVMKKDAVLRGRKVCPWFVFLV